jgi:hypothetical protein
LNERAAGQAADGTCYFTGLYVTVDLRMIGLIFPATQFR